MDVGAMTPNIWVFEEREKAMSLYERASGARMHAAYFRPGGVHQDLPVALLNDIGDWADNFGKVFEDAMSLLIDTRIFRHRNVAFATVTTEAAIKWPFSGPLIRA